MGKVLEQTFSKEETYSGHIQMANKHIKKSSTSFIIRERHIKTTMRYCLILIRMTTIKKIEHSSSKN